MISLSNILPVHNQEDIIGEVFKEIKTVFEKQNIGYEIILVENGSTDKTLEKIKSIAAKYQNVRAISTFKGYGSAVLAGLKVAKGKYICYMPSDGQVDLHVIPRLWALLESGKYDLVKVYRKNRESWFRSFTSSIFSFLISLIFKVPQIDINGSPRILLRQKMKKLNLSSTDSFIDVEMLIKITRKNWNMIEIPMRNLPRFGGKSTRSLNTYFEFFTNIYKFKFNKNY